MVVTIKDNMVGGKSYSFDCRAYSKEGIVRSIIKKEKEIIKSIELWIGSATITVEDNGNVIHRGKMEYNAFSGRGNVELR